MMVRTVMAGTPLFSAVTSIPVLSCTKEKSPQALEPGGFFEPSIIFRSARSYLAAGGVRNGGVSRANVHSGVQSDSHFGLRLVQGSRGPNHSQPRLPSGVRALILG